MRIFRRQIFGIYCSWGSVRLWMFGCSDAFFLVILVTVSDPESVGAHLSVDHVFPLRSPFRLAEFASGSW